MNVTCFFVIARHISVSTTHFLFLLSSRIGRNGRDHRHWLELCQACSYLFHPIPTVSLKNEIWIRSSTTICLLVILYLHVTAIRLCSMWQLSGSRIWFCSVVSTQITVSRNFLLLCHLYFSERRAICSRTKVGNTFRGENLWCVDCIVLSVFFNQIHYYS